jgi:hypothetical protein
MSDAPENEVERENAFAVLRKFARKRTPAEHCELCSAEVGREHAHLLQPVTRQILCACEPCSILFSGQAGGRYRRIPRRAVLLTDFELSDAQWESLMIPINLAFFYRDAASGKMVAMYPSPAGATESLLSLESWGDIAAQSSALQAMEPDVEALLINRVGPAREYFLAPIDECYRLVGLIRLHWKGLSGGTEVWKEIQGFFTELKNRCSGKTETMHA